LHNEKKISRATAPTREVMGLSRSAKYYRDNPEARKRKNAYQKEFNKKREQIRNRVELNRENRERGTYGNGDGMDISHTASGDIILRPQSQNRGDNNDSPGDRRARG
jgi:hypothetical protein